MNQRLEIPSETDPFWTSLILSCWETLVLHFIFFPALADFTNLEIPRFSDVSHVLTTTVLSASSDPQSRPSFQELLEKLRELQRKYNVQTQMQRNANAAAKNSIIEE